MKIYLLYPTVRPKIARETIKYWINMTDRKSVIILLLAVDTIEQSKQLQLPCTIADKIRPGSVYKLYLLTRNLTVANDDIIIGMSDDIFPPRDWDELLKIQLKNETAVLLVNDGIHASDKEMAPLPILTGSAFNKLNRIIGHPSYHHVWSDQEFYYNAKELNLIKDIRQTHKTIVFEHRHFSVSKRTYDEADVARRVFAKTDYEIFKVRMKLPVMTRIKPLEYNMPSLIEGIK